VEKYCHPFHVPLWRRQGEFYTSFGASLPEDGSRIGCRNFVFFHLDGGQSPKKETLPTLLLLYLFIYALHEIEFLTDVLVLQETSQPHVPVTAI